MKYLYIAEKPSLGRIIADAVGVKRKSGASIELIDGSRMTWAFGHLMELVSPDFYLPDTVPKSKKTGRKIWRAEDLPIIPDHWTMKPKDKEIASHIKQIGEWLKDVDAVVHCGDPDREGQAIVDCILERLNNKKPVLRPWLRDLTDSGIKKALASMKDNAEYENLFREATARSRADWLVGMNLTRAATLSNSTGQLFSIGRVQTPVLALVVSRDQAIEDFISTTHYGVRATLSSEIDFNAEWVIPEDIKNGEGYLLDHKLAEEVAQAVSGQQAEVVKVATKSGKRSAPLPFSLSELQKYASAKFGMSAQQVLDIAQALYEKHKATSYPRSDCQYMSDNQFNDAPDILNKLSKLGAYTDLVKSADMTRKSAAFNDKKVTAHTAIIPTGVIPSGLSAMEQKLFDAIVRHYLVQFYPDQTFENTTVDLKISNHPFIAKGKVILSNGWTVVTGADDSDKDDGALPALSKGDQVPVIQVETQKKQTKPPAHFTEGTLIAAMSSIQKYIDDPEAKKILKEADGLGTEATRANIIETLKKRNFIIAKGKKLLSTTAGRQAIKSAPDAMTNPITTAQWEGRLSAIGSGQETLDSFIDAQAEFVRAEVANLLSSKIKVGEAKSGTERKVLGVCPCCGGDIVETPKSYGCSNWKEKGCKFTIWKVISKKKIGVTIVKELLSNGRTKKKVEGFISKADKPFSAFLKLDGERVSFDFGD